MQSTYGAYRDVHRGYINGLAAIAKLVEYRLVNDIANTTNRLRTQSNLMGNPSSAQDVMQEMSDKQAWLARWREMAWHGVGAVGGNVNLLKEKPIGECIQAYLEQGNGSWERITILQEALLAPVYANLENAKNGMRETDPKGQAGFVALHAGLTFEQGPLIYGQLDRLVKEIAEVFPEGSYARLSFAEGVVAVVPPAATPVSRYTGNLVGLTGAATTHPGVSLLGGGPLSAGGFGMTGNTTRLAPFDGMKPMTWGEVLGRRIARLPREAVTLLAVKVMNYVYWLDTNCKKDVEVTNVRKTIATAFLEAKYQLERDLLTQTANQDAPLMRDNSRILHHAFVRITHTDWSGWG